LLHEAQAIAERMGALRLSLEAATVLRQMR
jgi:hypothetical protein